VRDQLGSTLDEATRLFADGGGDSDAWFALGVKVREHADLFAAATYQLNEWPEPDDTRALTSMRICAPVIHGSGVATLCASARPPNESACGCETRAAPNMPAYERCR
jgi:hypothetical protein